MAEWIKSVVFFCTNMEDINLNATSINHRLHFVDMIVEITLPTSYSQTGFEYFHTFLAEKKSWKTFHKIVKKLFQITDSNVNEMRKLSFIGYLLYCCFFGIFFEFFSSSDATGLSLTGCDDVCGVAREPTFKDEKSDLKSKIQS